MAVTTKPRPARAKLREYVDAYVENDLLTYGLATVVVVIAYLCASAVIFLGGVRVDALVRRTAGPSLRAAPRRASRRRRCR